MPPPDGSALKQQTLKAWRPILTPRLVILLFSTFGIVFVPIGAIIIGFSNQVTRARRPPARGGCAPPTERVATRLAGGRGGELRLWRLLLRLQLRQPRPVAPRRAQPV